jgi:hypothetical protein
VATYDGFESKSPSSKPVFFRVFKKILYKKLESEGYPHTAWHKNLDWDVRSCI